MKDVQFGSPAGLPARDEERMHDEHAARSYPTPAEFVGRVGRVFAYCLGLAVLAHVIVSLVGTQ